MKTTPECRTWSVREAAQVLGVSEGKMYQLIRREDFPVLKLGSVRRVSKQGLEDWIEARAREGWYVS